MADQSPQRPPLAHIERLLSRCVLPPPNESDLYSQELIREAFEAINEIPEVECSLRILATLAHLEIRFDFTQHSICYMDPNVRHGTRGLYNADNKHLLFGANHLFSPETAYHVHALMSHEFQHAALDCVFRNERLPFAVDDEAGRLRFEAAFEACESVCKRGDSSEELVSGVFASYGDAAKRRELAVRVPHMLTQYRENSEENRRIMEENRRNFAELFSYEEEDVMPAMRAAVPVLEKLADNTAEISYAELTEPLKAFVCRVRVNFQGAKMRLIDLVEGAKEADLLHELTSDEIRGILSEKLRTLVVGRAVERSADHHDEDDFYFERAFISSDYAGRVWSFGRNHKDSELTAEAAKQVKDFEAMRAQLEESKILLLADDAGAGKSTTLSNIGRRLKSLQASAWVSYVDLKSCLQIYEKIRENSLGDTLAATASLLSVAEGFERRVFASLFARGGVVLLLDGVDEIAPKFTEIFLDIASALRRSTRNKLLIATRPQHAAAIAQTLTCTACKLLELSESQTEAFMRRLLHDVKKVADESQVAKALAEIAKVRPYVGYVNYPLLLRLLVDLQTAGKLTQENLNKFGLYEESVALKFARLARKGAIVSSDRELDATFTVWTVHELYAMRLIFDGHDVDVRGLSLLRKWTRKEQSAWHAETIARTGFLRISHWNTDDETFAFAHRTFGEFFAAKFVARAVEEALEADDDMPDREFHLRMRLALLLARALCVEGSGFATVNNFVLDYCARRSAREVKVGAKFRRFAEGPALEELAREILDDARCTSFFHLVRMAMAVCEMLGGHGGVVRESFFRRCLAKIDVRRQDKEQLFWSCNDIAALFDFLRRPPEGQLEVTTTGNFLREFFDAKGFDDDFYAEQAQRMRHILQLLSFLQVGDVSVDEISGFLGGLVEGHAAYIVTDRAVATKIVEIAERRLSVDFLANFVFNYAEFFLVGLPAGPLKSKVLLNFEAMLEDVARAVDAELLRKSLRNFSRKLVTTRDSSPAALVLYVAATQSSQKALKFIAELYSRDEMQEIFGSKFPFPHVTRADLLLFDEFFSREFALARTFRVFFSHSTDFGFVMQLFAFVVINFRGNWLEMMGLRVACEERRLESGKKLQAVQQEGRDVHERSALYNILQTFNFLAAIDNSDMPGVELERFLAHHLEEILRISVRGHEHLVRLTFSLLENFKENQKIVDILRKTATDEGFFADATKRTLEAFYVELEKFLDFEAAKIRNFLTTRSSREGVAPLMLAIDSNCVQTVGIYLKNLSSEEILSVFLKTNWNFAKNRENLLKNPENFEKFFENLHENFSPSPMTDELTPKKLESFSKICFHFLSFIEQVYVPSDELSCLFLNNSDSFFSLCLQKCYSDIIFKVFLKFEKLKVVEFMAQGLDQLVDEKSEDFRDKILCFWQNVEKFFEKDAEALRKLLLSDFANEHPLFVGIFNDVQAVHRIYIENCRIDEIIAIFASFSKKNSKFLIKIAEFENFFVKNVFSNEERLGEVVRFRNHEGKSCYDLLGAKMRSLKRNSFGIILANAFVKIFSFDFASGYLNVLLKITAGQALDDFSRTFLVIWESSELEVSQNSASLCEDQEGQAFDSETSSSKANRVRKLLLALTNDKIFSRNDIEIFLERYFNEISIFLLQIRHNLVADFFNFLKKYTDDEEISNLVKEKFQNFKLPENIEKKSFENFYIELEKYFSCDYDELKKLPAFVSDEKEISPILYAIDQNCQVVIEIFKKCLSTQEILAVFGRTMWLGVRKHKSFQLIYKNFADFCESLCKSESIIFKSASIVFQFDQVYCKEGNKTWFKSCRDSTEILFQILNLFSQISVPKIVLEAFLRINFFHLHLCSSFLSLFADKLFEIFVQNFSEDQNLIAELITRQLDAFQSSKYEDSGWISQLSHYWTKIEEFFDAELLREILLAEYKSNHPLFEAIFWEMQNVQNIYLKLCSTEEIFTIFTTFNEKSAKLFPKIGSFKVFLAENLFSKDENIAKFLDYRNDNGLSFMDMLRETIGSFDIDSLCPCVTAGIFALLDLFSTVGN